MSWKHPSPRAEEVAALVATRDLTYAEIAEELGISRGTVKNHAQSVGSMMGLPPREAMRVWYETREVPDGPPEPPRREIDDGSDDHDDLTPVAFGDVTVTKRQLEVAELVARGLRYRDVGQRLGGISEKTVSAHVQAICAAAGRESTTIGARQFVAHWYHSVAGGIAQEEGPLVYFIRARNGLIKIGVAENVAARLAQLQSVSPIDLHLLGSCSGGYQIEAELHERFRDHRTRGEWFEPSEELLREIERRTGTGGAT